MEIRSARGPKTAHDPGEVGYTKAVSSEYPSIEDMLDILLESIGPDDMGEIHVTDGDVRNPCIAMRIASLPGDFAVIVHTDIEGCIDGVLTLLDCGVSAEDILISENGQMTGLLEYLDC